MRHAMQFRTPKLQRMNRDAQFVHFLPFPSVKLCRICVRNATCASRFMFSFTNSSVRARISDKCSDFCISSHVRGFQEGRFALTSVRFKEEDLLRKKAGKPRDFNRNNISSIRRMILYNVSSWRCLPLKTKRSVWNQFPNLVAI